jgi:hypothetical protein
MRAFFFRPLYFSLTNENRREALHGITFPLFTYSHAQVVLHNAMPVRAPVLTLVLTAEFRKVIQDAVDVYQITWPVTCGR